MLSPGLNEFVSEEDQAFVDAAAVVAMGELLKKIGPNPRTNPAERQSLASEAYKIAKSMLDARREFINNSATPGIVENDME